MFQLLLDMYMDNKINDKYLKKAVRAGWITEEDEQLIIKFKKESEVINEANN